MPTLVEASRHVCQEARFVLTSLRGGPPPVARGELAQDLFDLRQKLGNGPNPIEDVARPFLQVVMDPRAAGPHTLVALRAIQRLLEASSLNAFSVPLERCMQGILSCKFEQTDAAADEAVEMAIADVLCLMIVKDTESSIGDSTLMDAFHTAFVTRNTFVHSPALLYHFEYVLHHMVDAVFKRKLLGACRLLMEFLVNQLLHTPLVGGHNMDDHTRDAQTAHDSTRTLCLRLARQMIKTDWLGNDETLLSVVQDELCLSLLMTGQAIWAYHDAHAFQEIVSLDVLSEVCATIAALWNTLTLRRHLISQFEAIFTGFYTRALVLLRKRKPPKDSTSYNANAAFDAEVEIILESLVDIMCLHDHDKSIAESDGGALETMFAYYDCQLRRSDVATSLMVELCRCCGGTVNEEGEAVLSRQNSSADINIEPGDLHAVKISSAPPTPPSSAEFKSVSSSSLAGSVMVQVRHPSRQAPAHLKELCAQTLTGGMRCLFRDDNASVKTLEQRMHRQKSIMLRQVDGTENVSESKHHLRDIKSRKRLMRKAARIFNKSASRGIEFLVDSGLLPDPVTPKSVAIFLRTGIVVGIDKKAVGAYLGEAGKSPSAGKSPACWQRDWFHKEVLESYCQLFSFERQSLLDGLRMFLACFRLPGEAQQIDRILQAFADTCSRVCEESKQNIFSDDLKRASDAAYLLSFSIIMLNTDRHNANIREDRKMSKSDFVKNNTDYGRDIMEKGKEFPQQFLEEIYDSICDEEIRTEGEGAEGAMTVERWKDVLRGSTDDNADHDKLEASENDAEDLTELVLEHTWKPIVSAIGSLWGVSVDDDDDMVLQHPNEPGHGGMLGVQGARLGMDLAIEMLQGVRKLGRFDVFYRIFIWVCDYTGLLGSPNADIADRTLAVIESVESQSAVVVALTTAIDMAEHLDEDCWKHLWCIIFELRDMKLIPHRSAGNASLLLESDLDLLTDDARRDWNIGLIKGDMDLEEKSPQKKQPKGLWGAIFGNSQSADDEDETYQSEEDALVTEHSLDGKLQQVVWNGSALSDTEDETLAESEGVDEATGYAMLTPGSQFESQLIREAVQISRGMSMPITGLERAEETRRYHVSGRARVRERFRRAANLSLLVSETRFLDDTSIIEALESLVNLVAANDISTRQNRVALNATRGIDRQQSDDSSTDTASFSGPNVSFPLSPASKAFAEILICEITLKNKSRLEMLWTELLQSHYLGRLTSLFERPLLPKSTKMKIDPSVEKCVTGLLRITICAVQKGVCANEILSSWKYVLPKLEGQQANSQLRVLDRHFGEGLWRLVSQVDGVARLESEGWEGLVALLTWCAGRGGKIRINELKKAVGGGFNEDDPALQSYRSLHHLLHSEGLGAKLPNDLAESLCLLVRAGQLRNYAQLSMASLDLFRLLLEQRIDEVQDATSSDVASSAFWSKCWRRSVEGISLAAESSPDSGVRQHALSLLTDLYLDKGGNQIPLNHLCAAMSEVCIPLAGRCIIKLRAGEKLVGAADELMIEFELCIGLMFKPMRHHLATLSSEKAALALVWKSILVALEDLLCEQGDDDKIVSPASIQAAMQNLVNEHLRNAVIVLCASGFLDADDKSAPGDMTLLTWSSIQRMGVQRLALEEWKMAASESI
ncbi:hypothetical protein MPSEU_000428400 [Mayamaea pseudoterrestris]|nr:hypothetical protein MPSEU_000428400 [Mayamaea pseudoterrestris]